MGLAWIEHPSWDVVRDASDACGRDLEALLTKADARELTETRNAQLATITLSMVVLDAIERLGIEPTACAGHSVGEYTALMAAAAMGFEDGLALVCERAEAMQSAADASPGTMLVVRGTDADTVDVACRLADGEVWLANYNSAEESVIAGDPDAVENAGSIALALGAKDLVKVEVGGAFHTPLMAPARQRLRKALASTVFRPAELPVVTNVDARAHTDHRDWPLLLTAQLCSPVRWRQSLVRLGGLEEHSAAPERVFVEIGPGGSLAKMLSQTLPSVVTVSVSTPADLDLLVDTIAGDAALHAFAAGHQGERLYVSERLVISPASGIFEPRDRVEAGSPIRVGATIGMVGDVEVRSPFAGELIGVLAHSGERVQMGQPVAWLRTT